MMKILALPLIWLVKAYQLVISPLLSPSCRYYPSCSGYAVTSLQRFGPLRGGYLSVHRLLRCNPWSAGGIDHVPTTWADRGSPELAKPQLARVEDDDGVVRDVTDKRMFTE
ncbi:membrane protein insertion efficiency factor YidD [Janibacter sp. DB-40]|uniref:membrane protein insertion efficiency factor YidD n=1 Tax=Janibacter sp. DB-40 TaxID=3028808 RepID=UPI002406B846|nr:membrane protein insertion efficiency factor YidD [Janibacter sp. DB-40]